MQKLIDLSLCDTRFSLHEIPMRVSRREVDLFCETQCIRSQPRSRSTTTLSLIKVIYRECAQLCPHYALARDEITRGGLRVSLGFDSKMMKQVTLSQANTRRRCVFRSRASLANKYQLPSEII